METLRLFWLILKRTHGDRIMKGFLIWFFFASILLWKLDPGIENWGDGLWLAFNIATSIGLGDFTVTTFAARVVAALLGLYGTVIVAFIPGLIASYYMEKVNYRADDTIEQYYDQLENLDTMSNSELSELSRKIKESGNGKH